jgi:fermentation-respiration switch protein FrsA (DUF1100 family)
MTSLRIAILVAAGTYVMIALVMFLQQRNLQYHPSNKGFTPVGMGLDGVSEETIATPDGERLTAWHIAAEGDNPTILFFHGNAGEIGDRSERLAYYREQGFGALFVSYRGYGTSSGSISEQGFITDALAAHDWLTTRMIMPEQIVLIGESLGTGVAVQLAAQRRVAAVALEAPYTSVADVAASIYWWLPVRLLLKDTFHSRDHIGRVNAPVLIQHGDADSIIPVDHGHRLFAMANEPKELVIIPGIGHEAIQRHDVWERALEFFRKHAGVQ